MWRSWSQAWARLRAAVASSVSLEATRQAVELHRQLATRYPDAFQPSLAMSLNNLGGMLSDLGQREAALVPLREAVELRRQQRTRYPDWLVDRTPTRVIEGWPATASHVY